MGKKAKDAPKPRPVVVSPEAHADLRALAGLTGHSLRETFDRFGMPSVRAELARVLADRQTGAK